MHSVSTAIEAIVEQTLHIALPMVEINESNKYVARANVPKGELLIYYRGTFKTETLSKLKIQVSSGAGEQSLSLDGTTRARDFPSAWRLPLSDSGNMGVSYIHSPKTCINHGDIVHLLQPFLTPVLVNDRDLKKGEELSILGNPPSSLVRLPWAAGPRAGTFSKGSGTCTAEAPKPDAAQ